MHQWVCCSDKEKNKEMAGYQGGSTVWQGTSSEAWPGRGLFFRFCSGTGRRKCRQPGNRRLSPDHKGGCQIAVRESNGLCNGYPGGWPCREIGYHMDHHSIVRKDKTRWGYYTATAVTVSNRRRPVMKHAYTEQGQHTRAPLGRTARFGDFEDGYNP